MVIPHNPKKNGLALIVLLLIFLAPCLLPGCSSTQAAKTSKANKYAEEHERAFGVCPPFKLRDEQGKVIDPIHRVNIKVPYSPKQTCGAKGCHDYGKITKGFHFQQGKGEKVPRKYAQRYQWVSSPGNYGGNWCSPGPLYRQLAPKKNSRARMIDMTSFDFVTATCGNCHPGGGPLEYDRDGKRYDEHMRDPKAGLKAGADNGLDGDYFKAHWSKTGVIEADCLLCHMPEYDYKKRNAQLADWNFKWAATRGAGFAEITGKVKDGQVPQVTYDISKFDEDGNVVVHMTAEPRNETCLNCHAKPGWKKRGASFTARTDVHIMAGMRCVDCHAAGSKAADPRIRGEEIHQFGKGDDPSGAVRNDLDNTVRSCGDCHLIGWRNAPIAEHNWLPPLHMAKLSCQACHIPNRAVKSALVQASDVFNPAPRITPPPKRIWTFYDQQRKFWNHYGDLDLFTAADQPTDVTKPTLIKYKGKIYPGNRVHSAWVGYEGRGKPGFNQLFMKDFFGMWKAHKTDPNAYRQLVKITDDDKDGVIEVNRPEEIDALLSATRAYLKKTKFPMDGGRLVWVSDNRAYYSSSESKELPREQHEATPYASVYKFSHDVAPAKAALGSGGCVDCHRSIGGFFDRPVLDVPFSVENAAAVWKPNFAILGYSSGLVRLGVFREEKLKPIMYSLLAALVLLGVVLVIGRLVVAEGVLSPGTARVLAWLVVAACAIGAALAAAQPDLLAYMTVSRFSLDAAHFWIGVFAVLAGVVIAITMNSSDIGAIRTLRRVLRVALVGLVAWTAACGALMLVKISWLETLTRLSYTGFDFGVASILLICVVALILSLLEMPTDEQQRK
jgi:hypothetical protein